MAGEQEGRTTPTDQLLNMLGPCEHPARPRLTLRELAEVWEFTSSAAQIFPDATHDPAPRRLVQLRQS